MGTPSNLPVTSREYKLMLNPDRFLDRMQGRGLFLDLVKFLVGKEGGAYVPQSELKKPEISTRVTRYFDTKGKAFAEAGWILRAREELEKTGDERTSLNLKYRGADRYLSAGQDVANEGGDGGKFEEDILPPFTSRFSRSATMEGSALPDPVDVAAAAKMFPVLGTLGVPDATKVQVANDFTAHELVMRIGGFAFGDEPTVKMSLSFWYLEANRLGWPMVGEFSFDYDAVKTKKEKDGEKEKEGEGEKKPDAPRLEQFPTRTVECTNRLFRSLQLQGGWFDLGGTTKSAFALSGM